MKKRQNNSARASALQITLSVALLSVSAILFASSFRAASTAPGAPQPDVTAITGPASQNAVPQELSSAPATLPQNGFFPPLPLTAPEGAPLITLSLPMDSFYNSVPLST